MVMRFLFLYLLQMFMLQEMSKSRWQKILIRIKPSDYIDQSGGLGRFADRDRIVVIKPNGDAEVIKQTIFLFSDSTIYPGHTIYVPREIGKLEGIEFTATLAPIVSSLALSLASLNSIN